MSNLETVQFHADGIYTTVLQDAVDRTLRAAGLTETSSPTLETKMAELKYFNFEFSHPLTLATNMLIMANTVPDAVSENATFALPADWTIFEVSWQAYRMGTCGHYTNLWLDGNLFSRTYSDSTRQAVYNGAAALGSFTSHTYTLHKEVECSWSDSAGLAFVILYSP